MGDPDPVQAFLIEQNGLLRSISRMVENFKKSGRANHTEAVVRGRLKLLEDKWRRSQELHTQLQLHASAEQAKTLDYFHEGRFDAAEDSYLAATDYFNSILGSIASALSAEPAKASAPQLAQSAGDRHQTAFPIITLPRFSGKMQDWESFHDLFISLVHENTSLDNVQKLHYLKTSLSGDAERLLRHLTTTAANYSVAWKMLTDEFCNPRLAATIHLDAIVNAPSIKRGTNRELKLLRDTIKDAMSALRNLQRPVDAWSDLLVALVQQKLNPETRRAWEKHLGKSTEFPKYDSLEEFLDTLIKIESVMEVTVPRLTIAQNSNHARANEAQFVRSHASTASSPQCKLCHGGHSLFACPDFKARTVAERASYVKEQRCCPNCLSSGHALPNCRSRNRCFRCRRQHHTLLHRENGDPVPHQDHDNSHSATSANSGDHPTVVRCNFLQGDQSVLLATAWLKIQTSEGREEHVRALIDPGSEATFVTESLVQTLRASRRKVDVIIAGAGGDPIGRVRHSTELDIMPCERETPKIAAQALVLPRVSELTTGNISAAAIRAQFPQLRLADANLHPQHPLDIILGADLYGRIIRKGLKRGQGGHLVAHQTIFGWIVLGPIKILHQSPSALIRTHHILSTAPLDAAFQKFWETEEPPSASPLTDEERQCEEHYTQTHRRDASGRYIVRLPFKAFPPLEIGYSKKKAGFLLQKLSARLQRSPDLASAYHSFMEEYEQMGHMRRVPDSAPITHPPVYIPHHAVLREDRATTKVRVVFNASSSMSNGRSLNELLHVGPKLQSDLPTIILRWRKYQFAYSADIQKMYRQIRVDERDIDYQRILWKAHSSVSPQAYQLLTVTYGTACAPYIAIRTLQQLARDEGERFPLARPILETNFYVDDVLFGAHDEKTALITREQLQQVLAAGGFRLHKWTANRPSLISNLPAPDCSDDQELQLHDENSLKILGLSWVPGQDAFRFQVALSPRSQDTKRTVSSAIARLFDPLGWIAPVVVYAKIILQELWLLKGDWDDPLSGDLQSRWAQYVNALPALHKLRIPRWTRQLSSATTCELHGFADASSRAFGAAVYLRVLTPQQEPVITLLTSKTRIAPIKTLSIPRLELNAATLLTNLLHVVIPTLDDQQAPIYCWTDSSVVLAWLRKPPCHWKTFVANRVSLIQTLLPHAVWRHVPSHENPADCASRGLLAPDLVNHPLWWTGPAWLRDDINNWPLSEEIPTPHAEADVRTVLHIREKDHDEWELPHRVSSWPRLLRVVAYCLRFINRIRPRATRIEPPLSVALLGSEVTEAELRCLRYVQRCSFAAEIDACRLQRPITNSPLQRLNVFIDEQFLLRVGGRLQHSMLSFSEKHPIILPSHRVSDLIVADAHRRTLHGGPQLTLRVLRQRFWLLSARNIVRKLIYRCIPCTRKRAETPTQLMGNLPTARVTPHRPFTHCGVDYAGPVFVRPIRARGQRARKAYVAVFVCLSTRAIHLELAGDCSAETFLLAFRRFVSRRGLPSDMYSDNGTNFRGADQVLERDFKNVLQDPSLQSTLASDGINWHFIPPAAPHFGGLWEAGVKAMKHHLSRVLGTRTLSIEEFTTLLAQIEACLNSRPIGPNTLDPDDTAPLTPGHFLVGAPLVTVPEPSVLHVNENRLNRWQLVRRALEEFWRAWAHDYLHTLQARTKWERSSPNFQEGDLVILRNNSLPPAKWELGRITAIHPGDDNRVRVVRVRTAKHTVQRPISQLVRLPIATVTSSEDNDKES